MCCVVLANFVESSSGLGGIGVCLSLLCCHPSFEQLLLFLGVGIIRIMFSENWAKGKSLVPSHSLNFCSFITSDNNSYTNQDTMVLSPLPPLPFTILTLKNCRGPR